MALISNASFLRSVRINMEHKRETSEIFSMMNRGEIAFIARECNGMLHFVVWVCALGYVGSILFCRYLTSFFGWGGLIPFGVGMIALSILISRQRHR